MPAITVSTKVTAPHSRRSTSQFTKAKFYRRLKVVVVGEAFLFLLLALVQEWEEVLNQDLAVRLLVDGDAPFVEGARDFDLEVFLRGLIPNNFVVVESSSS